MQEYIHSVRLLSVHEHQGHGRAVVPCQYSIHTFSLRDSQLDGVELLARDIELETPIASFDGVRPILSDEISFFRGDAFEEIGLLGVISA